MLMVLIIYYADGNGSQPKEVSSSWRSQIRRSSTPPNLGQGHKQVMASDRQSASALLDNARPLGRSLLFFELMAKQ